MRDDHDGAPRAQLLHGPRHRGLVRAVERAGRLVEQQHGRVLEEGAGDGHALALPAGQGRAALAHPRVPAAGQALDHLGEPRPPGRLADLLRARPRPPDAHVLLDRRIEQVDVLEDHGDPLHERIDPRRAHIDPAHAHAPGVHVPEAGHEPRDRRLARARRPHERRHAAGGEGQGRAVNDLPSGRVAEGHAVEDDVVGRLRHRLLPGGGLVHDRRVQDGADGLQGHARLVHGVHVEGEHAHRVREAHRHEGQGHEDRRIDAGAQQQRRPHGHGQHHARLHEGVEGDARRALGAHSPARRPAVLLQVGLQWPPAVVAGSGRP